MTEKRRPKSGYEYTVSGSYYARDGRNKETKNFSDIKVMLPTQVEALHKIRRILIDPILKKMDKSCIRHRTCEIIDCQLLGETKSKQTKARDLSEDDIDTMSKTQLTDYIIKENLAVDIRGEANIVDARQKVLDALDNKKFADERAKKEKDKKQKIKADRDAVLKMNDLDSSGQEFSDRV